MMKKPEVMYAWEHGFNRGETRKWLNRQIERYMNDGFGYFAVTMNGSGKLIGQAGLLKGEIEGREVVELGYIFDDSVWGNGYALEAAGSCVRLAFERFGLDRLYATIVTGNAPSVKLAEKLGMNRIGEYMKNCGNEERLHAIYSPCK
jgi:RimJ/RimL family protein N-acetyltransferase